MTQMFHPFEHIDEKLERAADHIEALQIAVNSLLDSTPYRSVPDDDPEALQDLNRIVRDLRIPPRIGILAGEVIHQTRSALDHIATALVLANKGTVTSQTQFPIYPYKPSSEKESLRYEGQIRGMTQSAKALIDGMQPCNTPDPLNHPLTLLKRLNNIDKHQALLVTVAVTRPIVHFELDGDRYSTDNPAHFRAVTFGGAANVEASYGAYVVFPEFGTAQNSPIIHSVGRLWAHVTFVVRDTFRVELTNFPWER